MSFRTIKEAQQGVWPRVRQSLDRHRLSRDAVKADPNATTAAIARARKPWSRVVMEETVWGLAKEGALAIPEQAAVIKAAQAWAKSWAPHPPLPGTDDDEDVELYAAVQSLATALEPPDDEDLTVGQN